MDKCPICKDEIDPDPEEEVHGPCPECNMRTAKRLRETGKSWWHVFKLQNVDKNGFGVLDENNDPRKEAKTENEDRQDSETSQADPAPKT